MGTSDGFQLGTRNHLLLTQGLAARGVVSPCAGRLGDHLRAFTKPLITMRDVEVFFLAGQRREVVPEIRIPIHEVALAHEYVAMSGDPHLKAMHHEGTLHRVKLILAEQPGMLIEGVVSSAGFDWQRTFMAVTDVTLTALNQEAEVVVDELQGLSYFLVNRDRVGAVLLLEDSSIGEDPDA